MSPYLALHGSGLDRCDRLRGLELFEDFLAGVGICVHKNGVSTSGFLHALLLVLQLCQDMSSLTNRLRIFLIEVIVSGSDDLADQVVELVARGLRSGWTCRPS